MTTNKPLIDKENLCMQYFGDFGVRNLLGTATVLACLSLGACNGQEYYVIASTGTVIGVEVSQNPATQAPQAKLGYNRGELAIVPSNRPPCLTDEGQTKVACGQLGEGARDVPDVLMELRYGGIFDTGPSSGIYQRLAVGKIAVAQPGAALMFARDADGTLDPAAPAALRAAQARADEIMAARAGAMDAILAHVMNTDGTVDKGKLGTLLDATPGTEGVKDHIMNAQNMEDLRIRLGRASPETLEDMAMNIDRP
jgi:hypothetical protein